MPDTAHAVAFVVIAAVTLGAAAVAMLLRNLIHSALLLIGSWAGVAAFYLWCGVEFLAFAQVLVYLGAVSMIVLFAVLLTRQAANDFVVPPEALGRVVPALAIGGAVFGLLVGALLRAPLPGGAATPPTAPSVRTLGFELMGPQVAALLVVGVLLTVALIGAVVLAATDRSAPPRP